MDCVRALTLTAALPSLKWRAAYTYLFLMAQKSGRKELSFEASINDMVEGTDLELCSVGMSRSSLMLAIRALERIQLVTVSQAGREKAAYRIVEVSEDGAMNLLLALDRVRRRKLEVRFRKAMEAKTPNPSFWTEVAPAFCGENGEVLRLLLSRKVHQLMLFGLGSCGPNSGPQRPATGPNSGPQRDFATGPEFGPQVSSQARCGPEFGPQAKSPHQPPVLDPSYIKRAEVGGIPDRSRTVVDEHEGSPMDRKAKAAAKKARIERNAERIRSGDMNLELSSGALGKKNTAETETSIGGITKTERRTDQKSVTTIRVHDHPGGEELLAELQKCFHSDEIEMRNDGVLLHFEEAREGYQIFEWLTKKGLKSGKRRPYVVSDAQILIDAVRGYRLYTQKLHGGKARREVKERIRILIGNTNDRAGMNRVEPESINMVIAGALYTIACWCADPEKKAKYIKSSLYEWLNLWKRTRYQQLSSTWKAAVAAGAVCKDPIEFIESLPDDFQTKPPEELEIDLELLKPKVISDSDRAMQAAYNPDLSDLEPKVISDSDRAMQAAYDLD